MLKQILTYNVKKVANVSALVVAVIGLISAASCDCNEDFEETCYKENACFDKSRGGYLCEDYEVCECYIYQCANERCVCSCFNKNEMYQNGRLMY